MERNGAERGALKETGGRIPIMRLGDLLLVPIQLDLPDRLATRLRNDLTERIAADGARGVLIDISSLEAIDGFVGRVLVSIAKMARVLGAETVVVGMRPAVAIALVELGLPLPEARKARNVEAGMAMLASGPLRSSSPYSS